MKITIVFGAALAALGLTVASSVVQAQAKPPIELRYTSNAPPAGNPWATQIARTVKDVEEESRGELKVTPFLSAQLGSEQDTVQQVARGRIDIGGFSSGGAALVVPEIGLLVMPFYFRNVAEQDCVLDNHMTKMVTDLYAKKGVQFMGWTEVGSIDFVGKRPLVAPKDLQGAKVASYANKTQAIFYASLGANANPLGLPEWIPAMQTGLIEALMTTITSALPMGLTKVAPVITRLGLYDSPGLTLMNKGVYDKLSKDHQEALQRAMARHPSAKLRTEVRGFENVLFGMHEKAGGQIVSVTQEQRDVWRKAMEPVFPQIVKETGSGADVFFAALEAGRKACAK